VCWKPCSSCRSFHLLREEFLSAPIHSPRLWFAVSVLQRFTVIVNNMRANVAVLPYDDHDRAIKLVHSLDRTVWSEMVETILKLEKYETLMVDELFSKLNRPKWTVGCVRRSRNRLTLIVWLSCLDQRLTLTCLRDSFLCLLLCPCQTRSSRC
jgi:hypothetical protein